MRARIKKQPDLTLAELGECLRQEKGIQLKIPALLHQLNKWGLSFKKTLHANEQEREGVRLARDQWREKQKDQSRQQLVFLVETGVTTSMTRSYGRAPKGERCVDHAPHGHWHTNTFIAALRLDRVEAPWLLDGPMNGEAILHYIQEVLVQPCSRATSWWPITSVAIKWLGCAKPSKPTAPKLSFCRPISPTSTPSKTSSQNSKPYSAKPPNATSMLWSIASKLSSKASPPRSVPTTSSQPDM